MKLTNTVRKKIWLCVILALLGFLVATAFALYSNQQLKIHLTHIRDLDFHLAMQSNEVVNQFEAQKRFYEESFLFGIPESAQKAAVLSADVMASLRSISAAAYSGDHMHPVRFANHGAILQDYQAYAKTAAEVYPLLAQGEEPGEYLTILHELAQEQSKIGAHFRLMANHYRDTFNEHVTAQIELAERNNQVLAGFLLALLGLITLVVNRAANYMLITPLGHIKEALNYFGRGEREFPKLEAMTRQDDIDELGQAFLTMAQELEASTVSKGYVDSILRNMNDSLIVASTQFIIRSVNRAALEMLGYREIELTGQPLSLILKDFTPSEPNPEVIDDVSLLPHLGHNAEKILITSDGQEIPVLLSTSWIKEGMSPAQGLVFLAKDITEQKQTEQKLKQLAQFDFLTGLPNRMVFTDCLRRSIHRAQREKRQVGLMYIDLDHFKSINDNLGHAAGDALLKQLAIRLNGCVRENDTIARLGGDEFAVILENISHYEDAALTATRLLQACLDPAVHGADRIFSSASIGIALYPSDASTTEELLRNADLAMYQAKEAGGNGFRFYADTVTQRPTEPHIQASPE